jgi:hypothetical protein
MKVVVLFIKMENSFNKMRSKCLLDSRISVQGAALRRRNR